MTDTPLDRFRLEIDVQALIDTSSWSRLQILVVCLAALAILADGFDSQLMSYAIPVLVKQWHLTKGDFVPVVACGLLGMSVGSLGAGTLADRIGRRGALVISLLVLGCATVAIGFAGNLATLAALRFCAGLGIGGALPVATTLAGEMTPARRRTLAVTASITCVPLGGMLAGLFSASILPVTSWSTLFWIGGLVPLLLAGLLAVILPESPRFLARRATRWPDLAALLTRMGHAVPATSSFRDSVEPRAETRAGLAALFTRERRRDTLALGGSFFLCLLAVYSAFSWLPTMLAAQGLDVATAASGLTAYNCGGVIGALGCALVIGRWGSRGPQVVCALGAAASALILERLGLGQVQTMTVWLGIHGLFVNAVQSTLYAVAVSAYPTAIRATGTATALAFGRLGAVLSAFAGAAVISSAGPDSFLNLLAAAMLGTAVLLMVIRRHIPARPATPARSAALA